MGCGTTNDMYFDKLFMGRRKANECMLFTFRDQMPWQIRFQKNALIYSGYDKHNGAKPQIFLDDMLPEKARITPFYWHGLSLIPAWISNFIPHWLDMWLLKRGNSG